MRYSAPGRGVPFGFPAGDLDAIASGGGDCDFGDLTTIGGWIGVTYDVRGDMDLDGDVDATDQTTLSNLNYGVTLGRGKLRRTPTSVAGGVRKGYAGYEHDGSLLNSSFAHVRNRVYMAELGRWTRRDPLGYVDGVSLYGYVAGNPSTHVDELGLFHGLFTRFRVCDQIYWECHLRTLEERRSCHESADIVYAWRAAPCDGCVAPVGPCVQVCDQCLLDKIQKYLDCAEVYEGLEGDCRQIRRRCLMTGILGQ